MIDFLSRFNFALLKTFLAEWICCEFGKTKLAPRRIVSPRGWIIPAFILIFVDGGLVLRAVTGSNPVVAAKLEAGL